MRSALAAGGRRLLSTAAAPVQIEEVTAEWLTAQLLRCGELPPNSAVWCGCFGAVLRRSDTSRRRFEATPLPAGPLARVHRLHLATSDGARSVVLKSAPLDALAASAASSGRHLEREHGFYKAMAKEPSPLHLPRLLYGAADALLLSDVEANAGDTLPADAASSVVRALGQHHASFWASPLLGLWRWLPQLDAPLLAQYEPALCEAALADALSRFGAQLPHGLRAALPGLPAAARGPLLARLGSQPRTLLHGDLRPRSLLLGAGGVGLLGWGDCAAGRGPFDVARLLSCGLEAAERSEAEHALLAEYHEALQEGGVTAYSMYDAWEDYRHGTAYALVGALAEAGAPGLEADAEAWCALLYTPDCSHAA